MSKIIESQQNDERVVKFVIASILFVDVFVLYQVASALVGYWHNIVGGI